MKKNSSHLDNELELSEILKIFWNEKILILAICFFFMVAGYMYGAIQTKFYKTEITIVEVPSYSFGLNQLDFFSQSSSTQHIAKAFNDDVKLYLNSSKTLVEFFESNNKISNFKNYLKEKNISASNYFQGKLNSEFDKNKSLAKYSLTYTKPLSGETFLNDYVAFVNQKAFKILKEKSINITLANIDFYKQHLEIAEEIKLTNPILQSMVQGQEPQALFYKGTKVLSLNLDYLHKLLNYFENLTFVYDNIIEDASGSILITKRPNFFMTLAFVLGLFFSFFVIFLRSILQK